MSSDAVDPDERLVALLPGERPQGRSGTAVLPGTLHNGSLRLSGQIATHGGELIAIGRLGGEVGLELGAQCARQAALNLLGRAQDVLGSLSRVRQVLKLTVFVASAPGFRDQHIVADSASQVLTEVLREAGRHARAAIGVAELPLGSPVEVEATLAIE
jgi:enamine deaminase RidA (YjgF/YER057c/UK114 family)